MPGTAPSTLRDNHLARRRFLEITGIATATAVLGVAPAMHRVYAAALTKAQRETLTADLLPVIATSTVIGDLL